MLNTKTIDTVPESQWLNERKSMSEMMACKFQLLQKAEKAFYSLGNGGGTYSCVEVDAAHCAHLFSAEETKGFRFYLLTPRERDPRDGCRFTALFAVNVYGVIVESAILMTPIFCHSLPIFIKNRTF